MQANTTLAKFYVRSNQQHYIQEFEVTKLKKKLEESEVARAHAEAVWKAAEDARVVAIQTRDEALVARDEATILADSLWTAHDEELKRISEEEKKKLATAREDTIAQFTSDLQILVALAFVLYFTKATDEACASLSAKQQSVLKGHGNYNPWAADVVNRLAKGIQQNRDLSEIEAEFNTEVNAEENTEAEDTTLENPFVGARVMKKKHEPKPKGPQPKVVQAKLESAPRLL